jgi:formylglycine-generating enzyme required for sulfatase activity
MHGNVSEWCKDGDGSSILGKGDGSGYRHGTDPFMPDRTDSGAFIFLYPRHVVRGGSNQDEGRCCRSVSAFHMDRYKAHEKPSGFRISLRRDFRREERVR